MKIAILFTLIGLSLCQTQLIPTLSCIKDDCREKIAAIPNEDLSILVNSILCNAANFDAAVKELLKHLKCVLCGLDDSLVVVQELLVRLQKADLIKPECNTAELIAKITQLVGGGTVLGGGSGLPGPFGK